MKRNSCDKIKQRIFGYKDYNNKGQIFIVSIIIAVTVALTTSYFILSYMYKNPTPDQYLGSYQAGIIDAINDGDKILLYMDQAANIATASAFDEYLYGNPNPLINVEGGDDYIRYCGSYVYRQWNTLTENCYPNYRSSDFELNTLINKHLDQSKNFQPSSDYEQYFYNLIRQDINFKYSYLPNDVSTNVKISSTEDAYKVSIFKDRDTAINPAVQKYLREKSSYSEYLIWPVPNYYNIISCFGYRGVTVPGASLNHPAIDIPAPLDTPVIAAASGTIEKISPIILGIIVINHGNGLKTTYMHLNSIADGSTEGVTLRVGDTVKQGQVIGYVGGRGEYSANRYGNHLHFAVSSTNVNLDAAYGGVSAIIQKTDNIYVNPLCFIDLKDADGTEHQLTFESNTGCTSICSATGSTCANVNNMDINNDVPYKFCDVYEGVISEERACLTGEKTDWSIADTALSDTSLTSDETLKITISIENNGDTCVNVVPSIAIRGRVKDGNSERDVISIQKPSDINVHKSTDTDPYTTTEITCTFTTNAAEYEKYLGLTVQDSDNGGCVLPVNNDGSETRFTISGSEITATYTDQQIERFSKDLEFSVREGMTNSYSAGSQSDLSGNYVTQASTTQLSNSEKAKFDETLQNINALGLMDYITEVSNNEGVSPKLVLGLITQESGGDSTIVSPTGAFGLFQVIRSYHEDRVNRECGSWDNFQSDPQCQVRVGVGILKAYYTQYGTKGIEFRCSCEGNRGTNNCQDMDTRYVGWNAAIRAYNCADCTSTTCKEWADYNFVETVLKYAGAWGYSELEDAIIKEELNVGIIGTYNVKPTFNSKINLDFRLFDMLIKFANDSIIACGVDGIDKKQCVEDNVKLFNDNVPERYENVELSMLCDNTLNDAAVNTFVEDINDCMISTNTNCECPLRQSYNVKITSANSRDGYTVLEYERDDEYIKTYFDYEVFEEDGSAWRDTKVSIDDLKLYKEDSKLILRDSGAGLCVPARNRFRLCLKTNYEYTKYNPDADVSEKITREKITLPFAIMVRDGVPPKPVTGYSAQNLYHAKDALLLTWNKNEEKDVTMYNLYLSDDLTNFGGPTTGFRDLINYKTINSLESYIEYHFID
ncbi:MAG: peptidoglycan DD-metalloendopeptidase family protein, partial [Candidatus Woesearchaeota archaeon]